MRISRSAVILCVLTMWFAVQAALAGVVVEQEQREPGGQSATGRSVLYLDAGRLRMEVTTEDGDEQLIIFRSDRSTAWVINRKDRTYYEITPAQTAKMKAQLDAARQQMAEQLAQMPPEQRKIVEQMMGQQMGAAAPLTVREIGRGETVGAYVCTHYELLRSGQRVQELWATPLDQLKIAPEEYKTLADLSKLFEPLGQQGQGPGTSWSGLSEINGYPVRTLIYDGGRPMLEERLVRAERKALDPALFELPAGLRRVEPGPEE